MFRRSAVRVVLLALLAGLGLPSVSHASGAWTTYIRMLTCNDVLALRDTVWLASNEAGIVRYLRTEGRFETLTREPGGLASNTINALAFDRSGRLWAGTAGKGASRLAADGVSWDLVNAFDGLPSDTVTTLRADGDTVWIGTTRGIALWNGTQVAGSVPDIGTPSPFRSNLVSGIIVLGDTLLVGTDDGVYLARLSEHLANWGSLDAGLLTTKITGMATDGTHVFAKAGVLVYGLDRVAGAWSSVSPSNSVKYLRDSFGRVVVATHDSLCVWDQASAGWKKFANAPVGDGTANGGIVAATDPAGTAIASRDGLLYLQGPTWTVLTPPGPVNNDITNLATNGSELWLNTVSHGVSRLVGNTWTNYGPGCCGPNQNYSFINPIYSFMLQFDRTGHVWSAQWQTSIERVDLRANPLYFDHPYQVWSYQQGDTISRHSDGWSSAVDSLGYVYVGGDTPDLGGLDPMGVDVYDTSGTWLINWKTTNAGLLANQVRAIGYDRSNHRLWLGFAGRGVGYMPMDSLDSANPPSLDGGDHRKLPSLRSISSLLGKDVFGIAIYGDSIWVLGANSLYRLRGSTADLQSTLDIAAQPAPLGSVHPLDFARDGTVWEASVEGVRRFAPGGGFQDFNVDNSPLADNEVRALWVDRKSGAVWIGTALGVNRYDPYYAPPAAPQIPSLHVTPYPNPLMMNAMGIQVQLKGNGTRYDGEVLDVSGRIVRRFSSAANGDVIWDGRDRDGGYVRSGVYFVHARANGHEATARVVVLR